MNKQLLSKEIAEQYLNEMDEAERNSDYKSWRKRWEVQEPEHFTESDLLDSIKSSHGALGNLQFREYIGSVCSERDNGKTAYRYAWKSIHEKGIAVNFIGIYESKGVVYLNENWINYSKNNMYMLLLNTPDDSQSKIESPRHLSREIAELYLDELFAAERKGDYESWMKRCSEDANYSKDDFNRNREGTLEDIGRYVSREYIGCVHGRGSTATTVYRYAWKSQYEKAPAVTIVGIYEHEGAVYLNEKWTHYGDDSMHMLILSSTPEN